MPDQDIIFIELSEVSRRTSLSKSNIYKKLRAGAFPKPVKLGVKKVVWPLHEIDRWQRQLLESRTS